MCRRILLSLWTLTAAVGSYFLRAKQLSTADSFYSIALWALLGTALLFAVLLVIPEKGLFKLSELRTVPIAIALQGSGALLITVSAAWQLYLLYPAIRSFATINSAALLLSGLGLFGGMAACCKKESKAGSLLLLPLCAAALQLISAYWESGIDPHLQGYDMRILFLAAAASCAGLLSDFVFWLGRRRLTLVALSLTVILAGTVLPSTDSLPRLFAVMGTAFTALAYLIALLHGFKHDDAVSYELVEDPFSTGRVHSAPPIPREETSPAEETSPETPTTEVDPPLTEDNSFDLSRVDRLLLELGLDDDIE